MTDPAATPHVAPNFLEAYRLRPSDTTEDLLARAKRASAAELHRRGRAPDEPEVVVRTRDGKVVRQDGNQVARVGTGNEIVAKRVGR